MELFFKRTRARSGMVVLLTKKAQTRFVISAVSLGAGFCPSMIKMHIEAFVPHLNSTVFTRRPSFLEYRTLQPLQPSSLHWITKILESVF